MNDQPASNSSDVSRRNFLKTTAGAGTAVAAASLVTPIARGAWGGGGRAGRIKVGVVGCGGRGIGA
ncbi:MAG: twin-arginine translocation signal domain-containing protein, partial [Planctomycetota bacterium]